MENRLLGSWAAAQSEQGLLTAAVALSLAVKLGAGLSALRLGAVGLGALTR